MEDNGTIHSPPHGRSKMRSRSFVADSHFYLRTITGEYKKTRWTELGVVRLSEDLADALNYVEEMRNLIALLEKEEKFQKMPATSSPSVASPYATLVQSGPLPVRVEKKKQGEKEEAPVKEKRTKSKRVRRPTKDKSKKKQQEKERGDIIEKLNTVLA
jgi:hypothetical protein